MVSSLRQSSAIRFFSPFVLLALFVLLTPCGALSVSAHLQHRTNTSHDFTMGDWKPQRTMRVPWRNLYRTVYLWTILARDYTKRRSDTKAATKKV